MAVRIFASRNALSKYALLSLGALALNACATTGSGSGKVSKSEYEDAIGAYTSPASDPSQLDPVAAAAYWGTRYNRDHNNIQSAVKYSAALRKIGSVEEAVSVITKTASKNLDHPDVSLEAGKALIEAGRGFEAVRYLEVATTAKSNDWSAFSAYGVALDTIGEHELAQAQYNRALTMAPRSVQVLNNKALSFALAGDLSRAETTLRGAVTARGADARVRQNLALVLALKGDVTGAERLARSDLPPQVANQNIAYFRSLMNQPAYWAEHAPEEFDAPAFTPAKPDTPSRKQPVKPTTPEPAPLPELREEKAPEENPKGAPIALKEATPVTNASATLRETGANAEKTAAGTEISAGPVKLAPAPMPDLKPGK